MSTSPDTHAGPTWGRIARLLGAVAIGAALVRFLVGVAERDQPENISLAPGEPQSNHEIPEAPSYRELVDRDLSPNADWRSQIERLKSEHPGIFDRVTRTPEMKLAALADRARNRAFEGAPPTIPHPIRQNSDASCLACHGEGVIVGSHVATKVSHPHFTNCTQCHVAAAPGSFLPEPELPENEFAGITRVGPGTRAYLGAPPTIPHTTWLRNDCMSCHGLVARPGLRTTHPWLSSCIQCHAPSAKLDQLPLLSHPRSRSDE